MAPHLAILNRKLTDVMAGRCPRLIISMPPRHGKSVFVSQYFPALYLGTWPDRRVILTSYEAGFAANWGRKVRDLTEEYGLPFFGIKVRSNSSAADRWDLESALGGMSTAGVGGPLTGKGADLLIIDDPIKNAEEANSQTIREKQWDWFGSTAYTRLEPDGAAIVMATRWHAEDLPGRLIEEMKAGGERWDVLNLPALAEDHDPLGREPGEALWPLRFDRERLEEIHKAIGSYYFSALYQGRPGVRGGGFFKWAWYENNMIDARPISGARVRYWDTAGTEGGGDYTAGVLMSRAWDGSFTVENVRRGQWSPHHRNQEILATAREDGQNVPVWLEHEAGVGGKERSLDTARLLAGFAVHFETVTGSKESRAEPFSAQSEAGNVRVVRDQWNRDWINELLDFPSGKHDDQVDATAGAFNKLVHYNSGPAFGTAGPPHASLHDRRYG